MTLPRAFYRRPVAIVARALLGCVLVSRRGRTVTAGRIVETEAYLGPEDAASHAAFRPGAHALLYGDGGFAYVFPAYGMHVCLNAVARGPGEPGCVLLRALEPLSGLTAMARRRGVPFHSPRLASGPGNLARALAVTLVDKLNFYKLRAKLIIEDLSEVLGVLAAWDGQADTDYGLAYADPRLPALGMRVMLPPHLAAQAAADLGVTRATERRLRFWIAGNRYISKL